jgi:hypothetical protein
MMAPEKPRPVPLQAGGAAGGRLRQPARPFTWSWAGAPPGRLQLPCGSPCGGRSARQAARSARAAAGTGRAWGCGAPPLCSPRRACETVAGLHAPHA